MLGLTGEGEDMVKNGSYEARVFDAVPKDGIAQSQLMVGPIEFKNPMRLLALKASVSLQEACGFRGWYKRMLLGGSRRLR